MGNLKKQTAIEWLVEKYELVGMLTPPMIERAKAMETDQLTEAYEDGYESAIYNKSFDCEL